MNIVVPLDMRKIRFRVNRKNKEMNLGSNLTLHDIDVDETANHGFNGNLYDHYVAAMASSY